MEGVFRECRRQTLFELSCLHALAVCCVLIQHLYSFGASKIEGLKYNATSSCYTRIAHVATENKVNVVVSQHKLQANSVYFLSFRVLKD